MVAGFNWPGLDSLDSIYQQGQPPNSLRRQDLPDFVQMFHPPARESVSDVSGSESGERGRRRVRASPFRPIFMVGWMGYAASHRTDLTGYRVTACGLLLPATQHFLVIRVRNSYFGRVIVSLRHLDVDSGTSTGSIRP